MPRVVDDLDLVADPVVDAVPGVSVSQDRAVGMLRLPARGLCIGVHSSMALVLQ